MDLDPMEKPVELSGWRLLIVVVLATMPLVALALYFPACLGIVAFVCSIMFLICLLCGRS